MNSSKAVFLGFLGMTLLAGTALADEKKYTLADLQSLYQRQAWDELLLHLEDVPPAQRDSAWNQLVQNSCLRSQMGPHVARYCYEPLKGVLLSEPANSDFAWKAGKWARVNLAAWTAIPFFAKAGLKPGDARCKEETVTLATVAGLALSAESHAEIVKQSQDLAFATCWPAAEAGLKSELQEGSHTAKNACPGLLKKGVLSTLQAKKCANTK